jgi:propanol-preferring alcohol dehydrogenase
VRRDHRVPGVAPFRAPAGRPAGHLRLRRCEHHLFYERNLCSVTANTRQDGREFFAHAARHPLRVNVTTYPLSAADRALADLAADRLTGAAVLVPD